MATSGAPGPAGQAPATPATPAGGAGGRGDGVALPVMTRAWAAPDDGCPLTAGQMAEQDAILAGILGQDPGEPDVVLRPYPDVSEHDHGGPGGPGFASGSALDTLLPGPALSAALDDTLAGGLVDVPDDALAGVILAARRCESRAAAQVLAAVDELDRRRHAAGDRHAIEHTGTEIALLLTLTRRTAGTLLCFAAALTQLPATTTALAQGRIHRGQADVIADETSMLPPELAAAVEQLILPDAPPLTTTALRRRTRRAVIAADPAAARRRVEKAQRDARVERYAERSGGTVQLAGRDLPTAAALAADQRINAAARDLKTAGVPATLAQLRAAVFLGLLNSTDPLTFLPPPNPARPDPATPPAPADRQAPAGDHDPADPPAPADPQAPADGQDRGDEHDPAHGQPPAGRHDPGSAQPPASGQVPPAGPAGPGGAAGPAGAADDSGAGPALGVRGTVNLTLPLSTWLGATLSPGDITGLGPVTAETSQQLADWIAANPGSRWCLTLTDRRGRAVGHGCARRPPPPPADTQRLAAWLARLRISPIQAGECTHARYTPGYRIPAALDHLVKIRQQTCSNPICARPAVHCDDDHTRAHDKGGITCECGLGPACRNCHQAKQAKGWRLEQPRPGEFIWQPPHGRRYPATPDTYPTEDS